MAPGPHLRRLLQVRPKVLPADVGEAGRGRHLRLGEVQPPGFGEEVGLPLGEPRVVERSRKVDLGAVDRPPVVFRNHRGAGTEATPPAYTGRRKTAQS